VELDVNWANVELLLAAPEAWLQKIVTDVYVDAVRYAPYDTGALKASIRVEYFPRHGIVSCGTNYWQWQEFGAEPHIIRPKGSGYPLKFWWQRFGFVAHFYKVHHPGNDPQPFMRPAVYRERPSQTYAREHALTGDFRPPSKYRQMNFAPRPDGVDPRDIRN
jgi:hypothetical protein